MNSASIQIQHQNYVNGHDSQWSTTDNLLLPILELSQFPTLVDLPLFSSKIPAGFPSPADDHLEATIDLNQQYVRHPEATFLFGSMVTQ